jgi:hypothetical protein
MAATSGTMHLTRVFIDQLSLYRHGRHASSCVLRHRVLVHSGAIALFPLAWQDQL